MIKIYGNKEKEKQIVEFLSEFRVRVYLNYPVKGMTRKVRGTKLYKIINFPI